MPVSRRQLASSPLPGVGRDGWLTTRRARLRIRKQHDAGLAVLDQLGQRDLVAVIRLDLVAEAPEGNRVADTGRDCACGRIRRLAVRRKGIVALLGLLRGGLLGRRLLSHGTLT